MTHYITAFILKFSESVIRDNIVYEKYKKKDIGTMQLCFNKLAPRISKFGVFKYHHSYYTSKYEAPFHLFRNPDSVMEMFEYCSDEKESYQVPLILTTTCGDQYTVLPHLDEYVFITK